MKKSTSAYAGLGDVMAAGFDSMLAGGDGDEPEVLIDLDDIEIIEQVRGEDDFEDEDNTLADLGKSLRKRQLQGIVVRPNQDGAAKPYLLVAGERRVRGARIEGLTQLRGRILKMTDEEAEDAQLAENIHRKNLSQKSEAKRVQRDLDQLGSVDAVLEKHNKGRAWLSKLLSLLTLPEQTNRLVDENITADVEVINTVKQVEKKDPVAAKELVEKLKDGKGKVNAREIAKAAKDQVKPPKKGKGDKADKSGSEFNPGAIATPADLSHQEPGEVETLASSPALQELKKDFENEAADMGDDTEQGEVIEQLDTSKVPALPPTKALDFAFDRIHKLGVDPKNHLDGMDADERDSVKDWLHSFYDAGVDCERLSVAVLQGFRTGNFSDEGHAAFALVAFLSGGEEGVKFNVLDILGSVK